MKAFFDSSVLVAVFYGDHPHHEASLTRFTQFSAKQAACAAHSLFEVYSVLTRMPSKRKMSGDQAMLFIRDIRERLSLIALTAEESLAVVEQCADSRVTGGAIYDALIAACAIKAQSETIFTWNVGHFSQLGPIVTPLVKTP